jgi:hypothetical protein
MVRDASTNCLPFSQVGGFVFGARAVTLHGVSWSLATASTVVDVTAEFLAQLAFTAIGLGILLARAPNSALAVPLEVGLGLAVVACAALIGCSRAPRRCSPASAGASLGAGSRTHRIASRCSRPNWD